MWSNFNRNIRFWVWRPGLAICNCLLVVFVRLLVVCGPLLVVCGRLWSLPVLVVYLVVVVYCCIFHQNSLWSTSIILLRISSSIPLKIKLVVIYTGQDLVEKFAGKPDWYLDCKLFLSKYSCISMCLVFSVKLNTAHNSEIVLRKLEKQITLLTNFPD